MDNVKFIKDNYVVKKILASTDESEYETLADGYKAQKIIHELLTNADKIILKLNANGTKGNKTSSKYKTSYNHWWNAHKAIGAMIDQWNEAMIDGAPLTRLSYSSLGSLSSSAILPLIQYPPRIYCPSIYIAPNPFGWKSSFISP